VEEALEKTSEIGTRTRPAGSGSGVVVVVVVDVVVDVVDGPGPGTGGRDTGRLTDPPATTLDGEDERFPVIGRHLDHVPGPGPTSMGPFSGVVPTGGCRS